MNKSIRAIFEPASAITFIGCIVAGVLGYFGIKNNDLQQTSNAILAVLGALAIAQILAGYESSKVRKNIDRLLQSTPSLLGSRKELDAHEPF